MRQAPTRSPRPSRWRRAGTVVFGSALTLSGMVMLVGVATQAGQASADTAPFELFCSGTPLGDLAVNDVVMTGTLSPASPSPGQQFTLEDFQTQVTLPSSIVQAAAAVGNTSLSGTATATIVAQGATPSTTSTGSIAFDTAIPDPVPASGVQVDAPDPPASIGPFTDSSSNVSLAMSSSITLTFDDAALPGLPPFSCSAYPDDVVPTGFTQQLPPGLPISPVIAFAGTPPPSPSTNTVTGPYELYCPGTPVGDLDFNNVTTSATISPATLSAGSQFQVTGYQVDIPVPPGPVTAAVGLSNNSFDGLATSSVDAYGASPPQVPTGTMGFDVPIPDPVPSSGVDVDLPTSPTDIGPFTADGGPVTIAQDQSILVVAELSSKAFKMSCSAYPNDALTTSGSTGEPPPGSPIQPVIAVANASGPPVTTTTTVPGGTTPPAPGAPYELYCPGTPVGDIAINDVVTTGSISPASLAEGDQFEVGDLQTQFTIPQSIAQQLEAFGLTSLSGDLSLFLGATGSEYGVGYAGGGGSEPAYPFPLLGEADLAFDVTLPSPVPDSGVQFTASPPSGSEPPTWIAAGGPIDVSVDGANLAVSAFGDQFGLFCDTLSDNSVPTGLSVSEPYDDFTTPLVTTGSATVVPPPPGPPGAYELFCPGTPVGSIALNDVVTSGTIPDTLSSGQSFNVTGYQTTLNIPSSIASAAQALGNTAITGTANTAVDATGATPSSIPGGTLDFDIPIPSPVPAAGVSVSLPSTPETIGPFTAASSSVTIEEDSSVSLTLVISGNTLDLSCTAYPDNSLPEGIAEGAPSSSPISPVIATAGQTVPPSPGTSIAPATSTTTPTFTTTTTPGAAASGDGSSGSTKTDGAAGAAGTTPDPDAQTASSGSLAFTGTGDGLRRMAVLGAGLLLLGLLLLVAVDTPRRLLLRLASVRGKARTTRARGTWIPGR